MLRRTLLIAFLVVAIQVVAGCASGTASPAGCTTPAACPALTASPLGPTVSPESLGSGVPSTPSPAATNEGFPFAASAITGYYRTLGYVCRGERPSSIAQGFVVQPCTLVGDDDRTRTIGVITDADGLVASGFASIEGAAGEAFLDPVIALEPLSGFLGAMLGEEPGAALVPWLAAHLGDAYADETAGPITVATYTPSANDHSTLTVEVANDAYLAAPGTPEPS